MNSVDYVSIAKLNFNPEDQPSVEFTFFEEIRNETPESGFIEIRQEGEDGRIVLTAKDFEQISRSLLELLKVRYG